MDTDCQVRPGIIALYNCKLNISMVTWVNSAITTWADLSAAANSHKSFDDFLTRLRSATVIPSILSPRILYESANENLKRTRIVLIQPQKQ